MSISKGKLILLVSIPFTIALAWGILTTIRLSDTQAKLQQNLVTLSQTQDELGTTKQQLAEVKTELTAAEDNLTQTKAILAQTQAQLNTTQTELGNAQTQLLTTVKKLSDANTQLLSTQTQLAATKSQLTAAQSQLSDTQSQLASSMQQVTDYKKTMQALGITVHSSDTSWTFNGLQWTHNDNSSAVNPTWNQLTSFVLQDRTDQNPYNLRTFNCVNYSTTVYNNAELLNIESAVVTLNLKSATTGHAVNAFITSDYGLVYVDCTGNDAISRVEAGKVYRAVSLSSVPPGQVRIDSWWDALTGNYYYLPDNNGGQAVVDSIDIYW